MDQALEQKILDELYEHFEDVETQSAAILNFLKAKGIATDKDLAPYFEQASKATSVKWVAERARISYLLSSAAPPSVSVVDQSSSPTESTPEHNADKHTKTTHISNEKEIHNTDQDTDKAKTEEAVATSAE
jgi:hypothetical protein